MAQKRADDRLPVEEEALFSKLEIKYTRNKEDVWESIQATTIEQKPRRKVATMPHIYWRVAASITIAVGIGLFLRFYTAEVVVHPGQSLSHTLPAGSVVHLNAESRMSYHPYWWTFDRRIQFDGEAYFEVEKGKSFTAESLLGTTEVLGTSFNIYSRNDEYQVFCTSGKVKVTSTTTNTALLSKGDYVTTNSAGILIKERSSSEDEILSWRINKFLYNTTPLKKVFDDLSRHYDMQIILANDDIKEHYFTGMFTRDISGEQALALICHTFDLTFTVDTTNVYIVR